MDAAAPEPSPTYLQLRDRLLHLTPAELGLTPTQTAPHVWGVLVEMGYEVGSATLVCLVDGTTSLHYSTGGGLLGRGDYAPVADASKSVVMLAEKHLQHTAPADNFPLPEVGQVRFILLTYAGFLTAEATEESLSSGQHPLSPLYKRAQETSGQVRSLAVKRNK